MKIFVALCFSALVASGLCCGPAQGNNPTDSPAGSQSATQSQAAATTQDPNAAACAAAACDFSKDTCQYKAGGDDPWKAVSGRSGNRDTGISGPDQGGSQYVDARPKKGGKSTFTSGDLNNAADIQVLVRYWECTNKMNIKEATTSQDVSRDGVDASDRQWNSKILKVPANTKNLQFVCDNHGDNIGDCGISKITVVDASGNDVCGGGGGGGGGGGSSGGGASSSTAAPSKKRRTQRRRKQQ